MHKVHIWGMIMVRRVFVAEFRSLPVHRTFYWGVMIAEVHP